MEKMEKNSNFYRREKINSRFKARRAIIFIFLMFSIILFCTNFVSAGADWDNIKQYNEETKTITLYNWNVIGLIFDIRLADYKLTDNSDHCLINCYATGTATLYYDEQLFRDMKFYNSEGKEKELKEYKIFVEVEREEQREHGNYTSVCEKELLNGTMQDVCTTKLIGTYNETVILKELQEYKGQTLEPGTYRWRIEGKKNPLDDIEWIGSAFGKDLTEWDWWDSDWTYKKEINITTTDATSRINVSVPINISYEANMMANFTDIRFADEEEDEELYYWFYDNEVADSASALVYVKMNRAVSSAQQEQVYMYYGNDEADYVSNISNAFAFGDDFLGDAVDFTTKWFSNDESKYTVLNGILNATKIEADDKVMTTLNNFTNFISEIKARRINADMKFRLLHAPQPGIRAADADMIKVDADEAFYNYVAGQDSHATLPSDYAEWGYFGRSQFTVTGSVSAVNQTGKYANGTYMSSNNRTGTKENAHVGIYCYNPALPGQYDWVAVRGYIKDTSYVIGAETENVLPNTAPTLTLIEPANETNSSINSMVFNCTAQDDRLLENISLWIDGVRNHTVIIGDTNRSELWVNLTFGEGEYEWTCSADDNATTTSTGWASPNRTFWVDYIPTIITVSLDSPVNDTNTTLTTYNFYSSYSVYHGDNFTNATLHLWYANGTLYSTNFSAADNTVNATNLSFSGLPFSSQMQWNYVVCAINSSNHPICSGTSPNNSISILAFQENTLGYNASSWETKYENYAMNITSAAGTLGNGKLNYNGTNYSATITALGDDYFVSSDVNVPLAIGNKSFYFTWELDGVQRTSTSTNQFINRTMFEYCNASIAIKYVNYTFKDEDNLSVIDYGQIPTSTFYYWLGTNKSINKSLTYSNTTGNHNYTFCVYPNDEPINLDIRIQYEATNYPQRIYGATNIKYTNSTTDKVLYLLNSADGIYVTFQVLNVAEQTIEGVSVTGNRTISGATYQVADGTTDAAGLVTFWLNPNYMHTFIFSHPDYTDYTYTTFPTQSEYTIILGGGSEITDDFNVGTNYWIEPEDRFIYNDTTYNFNFTLTSSYWDVDEYGFSLYLDNGTVLGSVSDTTNGGVLDLDQSTENLTKINMNYYWIVDNNYTNGTTFWVVLDDSGTGYSVSNFFDRLSGYFDEGLFGADKFTLGIIVFLLIFIFAGVMSYKFGITSPGAISVLVFALVLFFDVGLNLLPSAGVKHLPTIVIGITMVGLLVRETIK